MFYLICEIEQLDSAIDSDYCDAADDAIGKHVEAIFSGKKPWADPRPLQRVVVTIFPLKNLIPRYF